MLTLQEYREEFLQFVQAKAASSKEGETGAFVNASMDALFDAEVIPDYEICCYAGTGRRNRSLRMDAYALDSLDGTLYLCIANYYGGQTEKTITKTEALANFERVRLFAEEVLNRRVFDDIEINTPVYDLIETIRDSATKIAKFKILLITDMQMSERINELDAAAVCGIPAEMVIWDISRFYRIYSSIAARDEIEIDFCQYNSGGIPCLEASDAATKDCKSYLCIIPAKVLADIYDKHGSRLLEGNVRAFLSAKGGVNKAIRRTIIVEPEMFFAYNNGISATALEVEINDENGQKAVVYAKDLQIVNGGQTTASLSLARHKNETTLENLFVPMKLTLVDPENANVIIPNISRSSNSQNKVSDADFFSNHEFHVRMEEISRRVLAPAVAGAQYETHWYYERARGQYAQEQMKMTRAEKARFEMRNPKKQLILKTDFAKVLNSWAQMPYIVSMGAQTNFLRFAQKIVVDWEKQDTKFNEIYFKEAISLFILFKNAEKLVTAQTWYENGYRANIVTYSLATLARFIERNYPEKMLDLQRIWSQQAIPEVLEKQMAEISTLVFEEITDVGRPVLNVTQWCKRENCWKFLQDKVVQPVDGFENLLILKSEHGDTSKEAIKGQAMDNGIKSQIKVFELGADYWRVALEWAKIKRVISPADASLLQLAAKMSTGKYPTDKQCSRLLEIRKRILQEGFVEPFE